MLIWGVNSSHCHPFLHCQYVTFYEQDPNPRIHLEGTRLDIMIETRLDLDNWFEVQ